MLMHLGEISCSDRMAAHGGAWLAKIGSASFGNRPHRRRNCWRASRAWRGGSYLAKASALSKAALAKAGEIAGGRGQWRRKTKRGNRGSESMAASAALQPAVNGAAAERNASAAQRRRRRKRLAKALRRMAAGCNIARRQYWPAKHIAKWRGVAGESSASTA